MPSSFDPFAFDPRRDRTQIRRLTRREMEDRINGVSQPRAFRYEAASSDPRVSFAFRFPLFDRSGKSLDYAAQVRHARLAQERQREARSKAPEVPRPSSTVGGLSVMVSELTNVEHENFIDSYHADVGDDMQASRSTESDVSFYRPTPWARPSTMSNVSTNTFRSTNVLNPTDEIENIEESVRLSTQLLKDDGFSGGKSGSSAPPLRSSTKQFDNSSRSSKAFGTQNTNRPSTVQFCLDRNTTTDVPQYSSSFAESELHVAEQPVQSRIIDVNSTLPEANASGRASGRQSGRPSAINSSRSSEIISLHSNSPNDDEPRREAVLDRSNASLNTSDVSGNQARALPSSRFTLSRDSGIRTTKELFARSTVLKQFDPRYTTIDCRGMDEGRAFDASLAAEAIEKNFITAAMQFGAYVQHDLRGSRAAFVGATGGKWQLGKDTYDIGCSVGRDVWSATDASGNPYLLYAWDRTDADSPTESVRAALGLACCAPDVQITGYHYDDAGVTAVKLLNEAVPLSSLSVSPELKPSVTYALVNLILRPLTASLMVHGSLTPENIFIAVGRSGINVVPIRWENFIDFRAFSDSRAGRTVPMVMPPVCARSDRGRPVTIGTDVHDVIGPALNDCRDLRVGDAKVLNALRQCIDTAASRRPVQANLTISLSGTLSAIKPKSTELWRALNEAFENVYMQ